MFVLQCEEKVTKSNDKFKHMNSNGLDDLLFKQKLEIWLRTELHQITIVYHIPGLVASYPMEIM